MERTVDISGPVASILRSVRRALGRFESDRVHDGDVITARFGELTLHVAPDDLDGGWVAECIEMPGVVTQGETKDEALRSLRDAIIEVVGVRIECALEGPTPGDDASEDRSEGRDTYSVAL